ncbi:hypothethical protein (plasmid) [Ralstonia solanacearum CMR15]|nr:hypothethical protein [Ralstonia solanacearum CMR15]
MESEDPHPFIKIDTKGSGAQIDFTATDNKVNGAPLLHSDAGGKYHIERNTGDMRQALESEVLPPTPWWKRVAGAMGKALEKVGLGLLAAWLKQKLGI